MKRTIKMLVKETRYKEIVLTPEDYDIPEDITEFVEFCAHIKDTWQDVAEHNCQKAWERGLDDDCRIMEFKVEENTDD